MSRGQPTSRREWAFVLVVLGGLLVNLRWSALQQDRAFSGGADTVTAAFDSADQDHWRQHRMSFGSSRVAEYHVYYHFAWHEGALAGRYDEECGDEQDPAGHTGCDQVKRLLQLDSFPVAVARTRPALNRPVGVKDRHASDYGVVIAGFLLFPLALFLWTHDFGNG